MGNLAPLTRLIAPTYDGTTPLPRRLERIARLVAAGELSHQQVANAAKVSRWSLQRLRQQLPFRARLAWLRERALQEAIEDEPLADKRARVIAAARMVRTLDAQLEQHDYTTVLGVSKQGNPIVGFDRGRMAERRQHLALIDDMLTDKSSPIEGATQIGVSVTIEQAVTRVQALLSRTQPDTTHMEGARAHAREDEQE